MSVSMRDLDPAFQGAGQKAYPSNFGPRIMSNESYIKMPCFTFRVVFMSILYSP